MEIKPALVEMTARHGDDEAPDTPMSDFIDTEQATAQLRDGFADYSGAKMRFFAPNCIARPSAPSMARLWMHYISWVQPCP